MVFMRKRFALSFICRGVTPDFTCERNPAVPEADFIHRGTKEADLYLVRNTGTNGGLARCRFRVQGRKPELWDPATGRTGLRIRYTEEDGGISLDVPLAPGRRVYLDLGALRELGEVFLNGRPLGVVWKPPFRVDLTPAVRGGKNELIVKITNLWINRLSGDMVTKGKRHTRTNQFAWGDIGGDETWREQTSGLLGPVKLLYVPGDGHVWVDGGLLWPVNEQAAWQNKRDAVYQ
jgi:hypothetical protein